MNFLRENFISSIPLISADKLISKCIDFDEEYLKVCNVKYKLKDTYIVGFGKAVLNMISPILMGLKKKNKSYFKKGILSVPYGSSRLIDKFDLDKNLLIFEGAYHNLPDKAGCETAKMILNLVNILTENDLLIVLISGGGSALLPMPLDPLSLNEKCEIIMKLNLSGADIIELNSVRKAISAVKGGKLIKNCEAEVVSFILSDIIDSPLHLIASGPTVFKNYDSETTEEILRKYGIEIYENLKIALNKNKLANDFDKEVYNVLIGDNKIALNCIYQKMGSCNNIHKLIISSELDGDASYIGEQIAEFSYTILKIIQCNVRITSLHKFEQILKIDKIKMQDLLQTVADCNHKYSNRIFFKDICILFGGETTVNVVGTGKGGRNQQMVLSAAIKLHEYYQSEIASEGYISFLSCGTDGFDGPTDAAGAITYAYKTQTEWRTQILEAKNQGLAPEKYLLENDSYNFFKELSHGKYHVKTGHTGTNLMDIQMVCIGLDAEKCF